MGSNRGGGRKKTPTKLVLVRGNPGKRPINRNEPQPEPVTEVPAPPAFLREHGRREWDRTAPILVATGLLTKADSAAFETYCGVYQTAMELAEDIDKNGRTYRTETGYQRARPEVGELHRAWNLLRAYAAEFGLTPASRSRVTAAPIGDAKDGDANFLFGG